MNISQPQNRNRGSAFTLHAPLSLSPLTECSLCNVTCRPEFVGMTRQIEPLRLCGGCFEGFCRWFSVTKAERQVTR